MPTQKMLDQLNELHREFLALGTDVEELVRGAVCALEWPDSDRVAPVVTGDDALAARVRWIADQCQRIVLLYQPVAADFREVTAILRMAPELASIGNLAAEITERSAAFAVLLVPAPEGLGRLAEVVSGMVRRCLDAYALLNAAPVRPLAWIRTEVGGLVRVLTEGVAGAMRADPAAVEPGLNLFAVVQNLHRIAEHATALAEEVVLLTGASSVGSVPDRTATVTEEPAHARYGS